MSEWVATPGELFTLRLREAIAFANAGYTLTTSKGSGGHLLENGPRGVYSGILNARREPLRRAATRIAMKICGPSHRAACISGRDACESASNAGGAATCLAYAVNLGIDEIVLWLGGEVSETQSSDATTLAKRLSLRQ